MLGGAATVLAQWRRHRDELLAAGENPICSEMIRIALPAGMGARGTGLFN
jgi:hypothetical protein